MRYEGAAMHEIELKLSPRMITIQPEGNCLQMLRLLLLHFTNPVQKISFDSKLMDDGSISGRWIHHESILLSSDRR